MRAVTVAQVWCKGMLHTLTEGQGARYATGGEYGVDKQTAAMKQHMMHTYRSTDVPCESIFGMLKYFKASEVNSYGSPAIYNHTGLHHQRHALLYSSTQEHKTQKPVLGMEV